MISAVSDSGHAGRGKAATTPAAGSPRVGRHLASRTRPSPVEQHEIGEGAADIDADKASRRRLPVLRHARAPARWCPGPDYAKRIVRTQTKLGDNPPARPPVPGPPVRSTVVEPAARGRGCSS